MTWFGILGPLEVLSDGWPVALGGPQQRALLALLLLDANRVAPYAGRETLPGAAKALQEALTLNRHIRSRSGEAGYSTNWARYIA